MPGTRNDGNGATGTIASTSPGDRARAGHCSPEDGADFDELTQIAAKGFHDPDAALQAIMSLATRMSERRSGSKPEGEEAQAAADVRPTPAVVDQGGSMHTDLPKLAGGRRPFVGFDVEREFYRRRKPDLLAHDEGRYVVIVGEELLGPFDTSREAEREGYAKFGLGPLYIKRILVEEPVAQISRLFG